ncbi:MAG: signal peptidase I [Gemmatimonadales bacterium]|nr:MAG: signal peptidase I [Gemmatimonadales bacterium]
MTQLPPDSPPPHGNAPVDPVSGSRGGDPGGEVLAPLPPGRGRRALRVLGEATRSVILALLVLLVVRTAVVEAFKIPTSSMEGTLLAGDFLLVNKAVFGAEIPGLGMTLPALAEPMRGEVIVFNPPHEPTKHYVKRLIGLPGDTISMKEKRLFLNGREIPEPYARYSDLVGDAVHPGMRWQERFLARVGRSGRYNPTRDNWGPLVVPDGRFFVLGDNRDNSEDSRYWGFVERESIRGRPWIVYYSSAMDPAGRFQFMRDVRWTRIGGRIE